MPTWRMKCSICDRTWDLERTVIPVTDVAPDHDQVLGEVTYERSWCLGSGEVLLQTRHPKVQ